MSVVRNLIIRAGADFSPMQKAFKKAARQTKQFRQDFKNNAKAIAQTGMVIGAAVLAASYKSIEAASEEMVAQKQLSVVMKQRMGATDGTVKSMIDLASAQQRVGVIEDGAIVSGAQMLGTFLKQSDSLKTLIPAMNDLGAQQYGLTATSEDMVTIGKMMGKVFNGQTGALKKAGISFSDAQEQVLKYGNESEKAAMLSKIITQNVGNMNEELANTPMGRMTNLKNTFGDLQEQFGAAIMPLRDAFVPALQKAVLYFSELITKMQPAIQYAKIFLETLFNVKAAKNMDAVAGATTDSADAMADLNKEGKKTVKNLLGFDEVNQLQEESVDIADASVEAKKADIEATGELNDVMMLNTEQIESARQKAEEFRQTLSNVKDIIVGFKDRGVELYNNFIKPFVDKLMGWNGEQTNTDFKKLGGTIFDMAASFLVMKGVLDAMAALKAAGGIAVPVVLLMSAVWIASKIKDKYDQYDSTVGERKIDYANFNYFNEAGKAFEEQFNKLKYLFTGKLPGDDFVGPMPFVGPIMPKANGGFVDRGQMFIAGEAGPEIVGTMGGKSAVANEDQIISGVAEGVRQGIQGNNQVIKLQIGQYEFEQLVVRTIQNYGRRTGGVPV